MRFDEECCGNCRFFSPEVHYSGGEQGWCIVDAINPAGIKMFDNSACDLYEEGLPILKDAGKEE